MSSVGPQQKKKVTIKKGIQENLMKEPSSKAEAGFKKSSKGREYSQPSNIRKPLSLPGLKGQVRGYQNPERSVTGWQKRAAE